MGFLGRAEKNLKIESIYTLSTWLVLVFNKLAWRHS